MEARGTRVVLFLALASLPLASVHHTRQQDLVGAHDFQVSRHRHRRQAEVQYLISLPPVYRRETAIPGS